MLRNTQPLRRIASIDGLRGTAVAVVILFHAFGLLFPGGFLGVDLFFVVSGYIITSLLVEEHARVGSFSFAAFYRRRARRLLPALLTLLLFWCIYLLVVRFFAGSDRDWVEPIASFFGAMNWLRATELRSGGELGHLWSLSVEEQFYLVWPILLAKGLLPLQSRQRFYIACCAVVVVLFWRWGLVLNGAAPERTYNGTDTRADALLFGCLLSLAPAACRARECLARLWLVPVAALALSIVFISDWRASWLHGPGFTVYAGLMAWLLLAALSPGFGPISGAMAAPPLVWLGRRSYSLYIWHYPLLTLPAYHGYPAPILALVATVVVADLSYRWIEAPFLTRP